MNNLKSVPVFVVNLDTDIRRREKIELQFSSLSNFDLRLIRALDGRCLPTSACVALVQNNEWALRKGTIACFLSHVRAWEEIAKISEPFAIVLEDDVLVEKLVEIFDIEVPTDAELIFLNDHASAHEETGNSIETRPIWRALQNMDRVRPGGPGAYGYLLTPIAARKLIYACSQDLFFGHVDGRLLRYATTEDDLDMLDPDTWIGEIIRNHHSRILVPKIGIVKSYCLTRPLVRHIGLDSTRDIADNE